MFIKKLKNNESSSHGSNDKLQNVANPCDVGKKHVSTSCDDLLEMPYSSHCELKLNHETLLASHEELLEQHASPIKVFTKKLKNNESSSHGSNDKSQIVLTLVM